MKDNSSHTREERIKKEIRKKATAGKLNASGFRFAIVVSRFNEFITERLLQSAYEGILRLGARPDDIAIVRVPGAFEIPSAARTLALALQASATNVTIARAALGMRRR